MVFKGKTQKIGQIGEDIACKFLVKHGFRVILRNYRKKFGEIDVIAKKNDRFHFVEVKTVSRRTSSHVFDDHRPEDNIHSAKLKRIGRTIEAYIFEYNIENDWQFDALTVELDSDEKTANVRLFSDLVF